MAESRQMSCDGDGASARQRLVYCKLGRTHLVAFEIIHLTSSSDGS